MDGPRNWQENRKPGKSNWRVMQMRDGNHQKAGM